MQPISMILKIKNGCGFNHYVIEKFFPGIMEKQMPGIKSIMLGIGQPRRSGKKWSISSFIQLALRPWTFGL